MSKSIGERLKQIRISKGLTLKEVEHETNISSIYWIEQGKYKSFKCDHLINLSNFYQVSPMYLLGLEEEKFQIEPKWIVLVQKLKDKNLTPRDVMKSVEKNNNVDLRN